VVYASSFGKAQDDDIYALAAAGNTVLAVDPRGMGESYRPAGRTGYRQSYQISARAILLNRNLVEMQAADLVAAAGYLRSRPEAAGKRIALYAKGAVGPAAIVAAAMEERIGELVLERSIVSYMDVVSAKIHEGLDQAIVPGILAHADLPDMLQLLGGRAVSIVSPAHPNGRAMLPAEAAKSLGAAPARLIFRGEGWPLLRALPAWSN
jgi:hypothetical protein